MGKAKAQKGRVLNKEKNLSTSQGRKGLTFRDSKDKDERRNGPSLVIRITKDKGSHGSKRWIFDPAKEAAKTYHGEKMVIPEGKLVEPHLHGLADLQQRESHGKILRNRSSQR